MLRHRVFSCCPFFSASTLLCKFANFHMYSSFKVFASPGQHFLRRGSLFFVEWLIFCVRWGEHHLLSHSGHRLVTVFNSTIIMMKMMMMMSSHKVASNRLKIGCVIAQHICINILVPNFFERVWVYGSFNFLIFRSEKQYKVFQNALVIQ